MERLFLSLVIGCLLFGTAHADEPANPQSSKPIKLIEPFGAGC